MEESGCYRCRSPRIGEIGPFRVGMGFMVLFWVAAIVFGVWAFRRATSRRSADALRVLEERFARGDIDQEEFIRRREAMSR